jgi:hypothetical protein
MLQAGLVDQPGAAAGKAGKGTEQGGEYQVQEQEGVVLAAKTLELRVRVWVQQL